MEFVKPAKQFIFRIAAAAAKSLWRISIRTLRKALDRADDWCHAQEVKLRDQAARPAYLAAVDPAASATRERNLKPARIRTFPVSSPNTALFCGTETSGHSRASRKSQTLGNRSGGRLQKHMPRLKYQHGEFVRTA